MWRGAALARLTRLGPIATVPNLISLIRIGLVGLFAYLVFHHFDLAALGVLVLAGVSDWLDGALARKLQQYSPLGALLDPAADRALIIITVLALALRQVIGWGLVAALLARELMVGLSLLRRLRRGQGTPQVEFLGKAGTLALMYAFPLLLLSSLDGVLGSLAWIVGWACALWGLALYWLVGLVYVGPGKRWLGVTDD